MIRASIIIVLLLALTLSLVLNASFLASTPSQDQRLSPGSTEPGLTAALKATMSFDKGRSKVEVDSPTTNSATTVWAHDIGESLTSLLQEGKLLAAIQLIDDSYERATSNDLERFKEIVFQHGLILRRDEQLASAIQLFEAYAQRFDDAEAWLHLGNTAAAAKEWDTTVDAYLQSSSQEHDPIAYQESLQALIRAASHLRTTLEKQGDQLAILDLYKRLYEHHPNFPRFQLELAQSYLRLKDPGSAIPLLEAIRFDPILGAIATQKLAVIRARERELQDSSLEQQDDANTDIVVPLTRAGNSFLVDLQINSLNERLLLDTGASITALSKNLIARYNLEATGQVIQLNTANGVRLSPLYKVDRIQIGPLQIRNLLIAEITMANNSIVQGLAGTDLLTQISPRHSYIIDNQASSLIFREK